MNETVGGLLKSSSSSMVGARVMSEELADPHSSADFRMSGSVGDEQTSFAMVVVTLYIAS